MQLLLSYTDFDPDQKFTTVSEIFGQQQNDFPPTEALAELNVDESELNSVSIEPQPFMEIAEREHKKWLRPDVELVNNPYSPENIENRTKSACSSLVECKDNNGSEQGEEAEEEEISEDQKKLFYSDRDITRYKRDYYLPKQTEMNKSLDDQHQQHSFNILNVSLPK